MKYLESSFEEYLISEKETNIKNDNNKFIERVPENLKELNNIIIYGPGGVGKYTQALKIIEKYSSSNLKYERKIDVELQKKQSYIVKLSDIHYEIDFELLGCNARLLWNEVFNQIIDILNSKKKKEGIILCKNFDKIHTELLEIFYSYMQKINNYLIIRYVIITENISFIPGNIIDICSVLSNKRLKMKDYKKIINKKLINVKEEKEKKKIIRRLEKINNIKNIKINQSNFEEQYDVITDKLVELILNIKKEKIEFIKIREELYNLLIYQLNIEECIWNIMKKIIKNIEISNKEMLELQIEINKFLKYYNNNYRPIFHLEKIILYLCNIVLKNEYR
jgi:replication-associated recombination protein RarA